MAASAQFVTSTDGTKIWAECLGATDKPCIVWVHGLSCSALPFDKQFVDEEFLKEYKMVRPSNGSPPLCFIMLSLNNTGLLFFASCDCACGLTCSRFATKLGATDEATLR